MKPKHRYKVGSRMCGTTKVTGQMTCFMIEIGIFIAMLTPNILLTHTITTDQIHALLAQIEDFRLESTKKGSSMGRKIFSPPAPALVAPADVIELLEYSWQRPWKPPPRPGRAWRLRCSEGLLLKFVTMVNYRYHHLQHFLNNICCFQILLLKRMLKER